jgi:hypothetical protein
MCQTDCLWRSADSGKSFFHATLNPKMGLSNIARYLLLSSLDKKGGSRKVPTGIAQGALGEAKAATKGNPANAISGLLGKKQK